MGVRVMASLFVAAVAGVGDPGDEDVVGVVDEVVAGEGVDELALAAPVRGGDRDELAVAGRGRDLGRPRQQAVGVGGEQGRGDEDERVVARARRRDDRGDRRVVADHETAEQVAGLGRRHGATIPGGADAPLTPR